MRVGEQEADAEKMSPREPLPAVQEVLKKVFRVVEHQHGLWRSTLRDCLPLLSSLSNLAEQLQAVQNVQLEETPLRAFPDLKDRLRRKLLAAGDAILDQLGEKLANLLQVRDTVSNHVERVFELYEQRADELGLDTVLQPSALSPSLADMLAWLQDIDRHYRNVYLERKWLLSQVQWRNLPSIPTLQQTWEQKSENDQDLVEDILLNVSFFLET
ncbi:AFG2-interacting ribosome maturation factor isoform X2 [Macrotis lagotis]|uniref:AFG2-interacting ribosome maturation factor isoform X2 n=1 Tax=Macrotis lagotis TaxID=92651 RepID=UPI003D690C6C